MGPPLLGDVPALAWGPSERLQALNESHSLSGEASHAWCREKGLFAHQLQALRAAFLTGAEPMTGAARDNRSTVRELQSKNDLLERQLRRKDKAWAEAAALLVQQKSARRCGRTRFDDNYRTAPNTAAPD